MNKAELTEKLALRTGLAPQKAREVMDVLFDPEPTVGLIAQELCNGGKVAISGFGTFEARQHKARSARNPHTGEEMNIPATRAPAFKAGKPLKESVRG